MDHRSAIQHDESIDRLLNRKANQKISSCLDLFQLRNLQIEDLPLHGTSLKQQEGKEKLSNRENGLDKGQIRRTSTAPTTTSPSTITETASSSACERKRMKKNENPNSTRNMHPCA